MIAPNIIGVFGNISTTTIKFEWGNYLNKKKQMKWVENWQVFLIIEADFKHMKELSLPISSLSNSFFLCLAQRLWYTCFSSWFKRYLWTNAKAWLRAKEPYNKHNYKMILIFFIFSLSILLRVVKLVKNARLHNTNERK